MRKKISPLFLFLTLIWTVPATMAEEKSTDLYTIPVVTIEGKSSDLSDYREKVILIVNTASKCGFTKQYKGLESLWKEYGEKGLVVLGFPCNQFGGQEPAGEKEIEAFCQMKFGVSFPLFSKVDVNGKSTHPLFAMLKEKAPGIQGTQSIKWNFTKFLVEPGGKGITRYGSTTKPESLKEKIESLLPKGQD
jgi:glutathione peroxidase